MRRTLGVCCTAHFLVDFACAFLLFRALRGEAAWSELLLLYNFCAFAVQMPLGLLADGWKKDGQVAAAGALLAAAAYGLTELPGLAAVMAGLGNAAFHVGGGLETMSLSQERAGPLGLFVSPGAVGLFLGTLMGKGSTLPLWLPPLMLLCTAVCLYGSRQERTSDYGTVTLPQLNVTALPMVLLFAVVVLRSYVGVTLSFSWKSKGQWALVLVLATAMGKATGGYLADRFGFLKTAAISLVLSAVCLLLSSVPLCGTAAIFLFNMTMPLTLWASARLLPGTKGFAFGILTFGLFLGFLPAAFGASALTRTGAAVLALVSLLLLLPGLRKAAGS